MNSSCNITYPCTECYINPSQLSQLRKQNGQLQEKILEIGEQNEQLCLKIGLWEQKYKQTAVIYENKIHQLQGQCQQQQRQIYQLKKERQSHQRKQSKQKSRKRLGKSSTSIGNENEPSNNQIIDEPSIYSEQFCANCIADNVQLTSSIEKLKLSFDTFVRAYQFQLSKEWTPQDFERYSQQLQRVSVEQMRHEQPSRKSIKIIQNMQARLKQFSASLKQTSEDNLKKKAKKSEQKSKLLLNELRKKKDMLSEIPFIERFNTDQRIKQMSSLEDSVQQAINIIKTRLMK